MFIEEEYIDYLKKEILNYYDRYIECIGRFNFNMADRSDYILYKTEAQKNLHTCYGILKAYKACLDIDKQEQVLLQLMVDERANPPTENIKSYFPIGDSEAESDQLIAYLNNLYRTSERRTFQLLFEEGFNSLDKLSDKFQLFSIAVSTDIDIFRPYFARLLKQFLALDINDSQEDIVIRNRAYSIYTLYKNKWDKLLINLE